MVKRYIDCSARELAVYHKKELFYILFHRILSLVYFKELLLTNVIVPQTGAEPAPSFRTNGF